MKKRILSFLLAVAMLLTVLPQITLKAKAHTVVMTANEFIDCLWTAYSRPNYYYNSYPYNLGYYDGSRISFDCWNLGKAIIWSKGAIVNNYTKGTYAQMDASCGLGDWDGLTIVKEAPNCSSDFSNLVPGEWLYKENHTGYYIGDGQVIECTAGWDVWAITISQIDEYGRRSRNGVSGGYWELHGMVPWLDYSNVNDKENPVISDVKYSDVSAAGYTVSCKVTDNDKVQKVSFPTWTLANNQDDLPANFLQTQLGTQNGDRFTFRVNASAHNNETGKYVTHIYAFDRSGNRSVLRLDPVEVRNDNQNPVISDVVFSEVSAAGYTISCKVTDDWGVHSVAFPTWTVRNAQDDLPANFLQTQLGTKNGDRYTFRVNASDHNNETGTYATHIYATDCAGNRVKLGFDEIKVMNDTQKPVITDVVFSNVTSAGYTVSCKVTDNWGVSHVAFPTWTTNNGQDDIASNFMTTQRGIRDGDTFTFHVKTADHNGEQGYYATHIYAVDSAGNTASFEPELIFVQDPKPGLDKITLASSSDYKIENAFLLEVMPNTPVQSLLTQFENEDLTVMDKHGNVIGGSSLVGTGTTVNLYNGTERVDSVTVIILGDVDGNGLVDTTDYLRAKATFLGTYTMNNVERRAADIDGNGMIDTGDYTKIKNHLLRTQSLFD